MVVIDSVFVYYFVDLSVNIFFEKEEAKQNGSFSFQIKNISTSAHLY